MQKSPQFSKRHLLLNEKQKKPFVLLNDQVTIRDFKMWYGEAVVWRQIVKITYGDVMTCVPLRLSCRSLVFYYEKVPSFMYSSLCEYKPAVYSSF